MPIPKKLTDIQAQDLMKKFLIPTPKQILAKKPEEAAQAAKKLGFPVVLKISSPDIVHKTEAGGILTNIGNEQSVKEGFDKILKSAKKKFPKAKVDGILVQQQISGREMLVGAKIDPQFGPVIAFGTGGIFVEILKDVAFRLVPIERKDAQSMIAEIKGNILLKGVRGQKPVDFKLLEDCLLKVSKLVQGTKSLKELDINPLFVSESGVFAADVRVITA